jgi:ribose-phosphate pyrophosphokinase
MRIVNLTSGFEPFGPGIEILQNTLFPSGAEVRLELGEDFATSLDESGRVLLTVRVQSSDCLMRVLLAADALKRIPEVTAVELFMPYFPYARQDRVMTTGHPLSVKVVANMLNACGFARVTIYDVHSDVAPALLDNVVSITNTAFVAEVIRGQENFLLMSPDAGAYKKIQKLAEAVGYDGEIVTVSKSRNVTTGHMNIQVPKADYQKRDVYIIDDIGEGCMSFRLIAEQLKTMNVGRVILVLSHGILSGNAETNLRGYIDQVYTTDSYAGKRFDFVTEIPLCSNILI